MRRTPRLLLIGSAPSSGSTLLVNLLSRRFSGIASGPETSLFAHPVVWAKRGAAWQEQMRRDLSGQQPTGDGLLGGDHVPYTAAVYAENLPHFQRSLEGLTQAVGSLQSGGDLFRWLFEPTARTSTEVLAEKSPPNLYAIPSFLAAEPDARAIVVVRDGRDVVCSLKRRGFTFAEAVRIWLLEAALVHRLAGQERVKLVRYEDVTADSDAVLSGIADFIGLSAAGRKPPKAADTAGVGKLETWTFAPSDSVRTEAVGRWRKDLSDLEQRMFGRFRIALPLNSPLASQCDSGVSADEMLVRFGYVPVEAPRLSEADVLEFCATDDKALAHLQEGTGLHRSVVVLDAGDAVSTDRLSRVAAVWTQRASHVRQLQRDLDDRNALANALEQHRAIANQQLAERDEAAAQVGQQIEALNQALSAKEAVRVGLEALLGERDASLKMLGEQIAERDRLLASIEQTRVRLEAMVSEQAGLFAGYDARANAAEALASAAVAERVAMAARLADAEQVMSLMRSPLTSFRMARTETASVSLDEVNKLSQQVNTLNDLANSIEANRAKLEIMVSERDAAIAELSAKLAALQTGTGTA